MRFALVGVGQAGGKVMEALMRYDRRADVGFAADAIAVNTARADLVGLDATPLDRRILIGGARRKGHGTGADNELGADVATEDVGESVVDASEIINTLGSGAAYDCLRGGESELVRERGVEIHRQATERLTGWRREAVSDLLLDRSGQVRRDPSVHAVIRARYLVDEANQSNHAKRRYLQRQLRYLLGVGIVALTVFLFGVTRVNSLAAADVTLPTFVLYVPLVGALGAALFGVRSTSKTATSTNVPQNFTPLGVVLARVFIGSLSAVALYFGLTAGVIDVAEGGTLSPALLVLVAFAAGYSERLAPQAVERVSGITGSTTPK